MRDHYCRPISIASINPQTFPAVSLYTKTGGNYVLYKPHDRQFTDLDRMRLERNSVEFLFVRTGDMEEVTRFLENGLSETLGRQDLSVQAKGHILYQTTVNYVIDVLKTLKRQLSLTAAGIWFATCWIISARILTHSMPYNLWLSTTTTSLCTPCRWQPFPYWSMTRYTSLPRMS